MMHPQRVVSLWDMIKIADGNLFAANSCLGSCIKYLELSRTELRKVESQGRIGIDFAQFDAMITAAKTIKDSASELGLTVCGKAAKAFGDNIPNIGSPAGPNKVGLSIEALNTLIEDLKYLVKTFNDEITSRLLFVMQPNAELFYTPSDSLFGSEVDAAFPSAVREISEAGKCRALGRWTACVMHIMRALEPAIHALQVSVSVDFPKDQWHQILDQIEAKIRDIKKHSHGQIEEQWHSEAASHFRFIKDAWRNYAAHGKVLYDEESASEIWNSSRALMRQLSTRLSE